ncbi:MAG: hypothetical protein ACR2NZ_08205 [Rubripirellula sp.]
MSDQSSLYFLAVIPLMWCFLSWLMSSLSGWSRLAREYRDCGQRSEASASGNIETARLRTGRMGVINYHSILTFRACDDGLSIGTALPFRLGHPPLFIPWTEFHHVSEDPILYSHRVKASIGNPTIVRMTLPGWVKYRMPIELRTTADA